jgi:hypothetical protein
MTMTLISTVTVGFAGAASIEFTGIPQTGTDLLVHFSGRTDQTASRSATLSLNNVTTGFTARVLEGSGSAATSGTQTTLFARMTGTTANTFGVSTCYIPNYTSANIKSYSIELAQEANNSVAIMDILAGLWSNTAAITSLKITVGDLLVEGSMASLYTITKGSGGATVS